MLPLKIDSMGPALSDGSYGLLTLKHYLSMLPYLFDSYTSYTLFVNKKYLISKNQGHFCTFTTFLSKRNHPIVH